MILRRRTTVLFALLVRSIGVESTQGFSVSLIPLQQQQKQHQKQQQQQRPRYSVTMLRNSQEEAAASSFFGNSLELQHILSDPTPPVLMGTSAKNDGRMIRYRGGFCEEIIMPEPASERATLWQSTSRRLVSLANLASLLCVIDCTVLPVVTILFPLLGLAAPSQVVWLHEFGHSVAIYFVLPVGGTAATMNFMSHKKLLLSLPALFGLMLIYAANAHGGWLLDWIPHDVLHAIHDGARHRLVNIAGCAMLLGSNYVSHRQKGACKDVNCKAIH